MSSDAKPARTASGPSGFPIEVVDEVDSTNRVLADRARGGAVEPILLVARHQTAGRGRLGRTWVAPPGSAFTGSWLVPVGHTVWAEQPWLLSVAVALAVHDVLVIDLAIPEKHVALKWPNDVMAPSSRSDEPDRKLCGILAEYVSGTGDRMSDGAVVVGAGLNVRRPSLVEGVLAERGVWVSELMPNTPSVDEVMILLNDRLRTRLFPDAGPVTPAELVSVYQARCSTIGRWVRVEQLTQSFEGRAVAIDHDGALIVQTEANEERRVTVADVVHLHASSRENEA
jgi:BirA family transcriptional regulator, biotin operon repressor / biotin---[acetyl-CoA-carboxylase] ligase